MKIQGRVLCDLQQHSLRSENSKARVWPADQRPIIVQVLREVVGINKIAYNTKLNIFDAVTEDNDIQSTAKKLKQVGNVHILL